MHVSKPSLLTHALSLSLCLLFLWFPAPGPILAATVPRLAARPWPPLTNGVERRLRIAKEGRGRGCLCLRNWCETDADRETGRVLKVHQHFHSFKSMWALQRQSTRLKPDLPAALCFDRQIQWQTSSSSNTFLLAWIFACFSITPTKCHTNACQRGEDSAQVICLLLGHVTNES